MDDYTLAGLFLVSFVSSTLLPGGSEAVLLYLATKTDQSHLTLWTLATAGNTLGGMTTFFIGYFLAKITRDRLEKQRSHQRALQSLSRWGAPALLFSWLPIIGDPLCLVAGWLRINTLLACLLIFIGKGLRYFALLSIS